MFKKRFVVFVFLAMVVNYTVLSQSVGIDTAISNAAKEISESVSKGTKIAVLNITSDYSKLSDYIIDELIVNLVNTKLFQIVPRSTIELELANKEFGFQMTGSVSDESQKRLGQFLGAGTIITGSVAKVSSDSYRFILNAIDLESFTYQSSYRISIQNDNRMKTLSISKIDNDQGKNIIYYDDYTTGERIGMGALNMVFGIGSIVNGQHLGWITTGTEIAGFVFVLLGLQEPQFVRNTYFIPSYIFFGVGILSGFVIPFFHHKPINTNVSQNNFPFNLELVSSNNQKINGFKITYELKF